MNEFELSDRHYSGKYSAGALELRCVLVDAYDHAAVVSVTEVDRPARGLMCAFPGRALLRGPNGDLGETAISVNTEVFDVLAWDYAVLAEDLIGMRKRQVMVIAALRHRETGLIYLRSATHTASGVEGDWASLRARQYRRAMREWRRVVRRWRKKWRPDGEAHVGDMNLSLLKLFVRTYFKATWPGMTLPAHGDQGSHGSRLIDWFLGRGICNPWVRVLPKNKASDHRPVEIRGTVCRRRKEKRR